jgi:hypothetical protein
MLISFLVLAIAFMIAAPATAMGRAPKVVGAEETAPPELPTEIFGRPLNIPETAGTPVAKASLKGKPNPDPINIEGESGSVVSSGQEDNIWVYPTGDASKDPVNIQYACDNVRPGGKVRLMAGPRWNPHGKASNPNVQIAFNLGDSYIDIKEDVIIRGEKLPGSHFGNDWNEDLSANKDFSVPGGTIKSDRAVIYGGGTTLGGFYHVGTIHMEQQNKLTVEGLRFEKSRFSSVSIYSSEDVDISNNVITNVQVENSPFFGPTHWSFCFSGFYKRYLGFPHPGIAGPINIKHNMIDQLGPDVDVPDEWRDAIMFFFADSPLMATIDYNTIQNTPAEAIFLFYAFNTPGSELKITNNEITQRDYGITPGPHRWAIVVAGSQSFPAQNVQIVDNTMSVSEGPQSPDYSNVINLTGVKDIEIRGNTIHIEKRVGVLAQAIGLDGPHGGVENTIIEDNTISGNPDYAVAVGHKYGINDTHSLNQIIGNDYTGIYDEDVMIILGPSTSNNTVTEPGPDIDCGDIVDCGVNNNVQAGTPLQVCPVTSPCPLP